HGGLPPQHGVELQHGRPAADRCGLGRSAPRIGSPRNDRGLVVPRSGLGRYSFCRCGSASRWVRPFHIRLTRCAATTSFLGSRVSSHHCAVIDTEPTSACAYSGARSGSRPRLAKSPARMELTWLTASLSRLEEVPELI